MQLEVLSAGNRVARNMIHRVLETHAAARYISHVRFGAELLLVYIYVIIHIQRFHPCVLSFVKEASDQFKLQCVG